MSNGSTNADEALAELGTDGGERAGASSDVLTDTRAEGLKNTHTDTHTNKMPESFVSD